MARLIVITDPDTALGFLLAGAEVAEVTNTEQATNRLRDILKTKQAGVVVYNEEYRSGLSEHEQALLDESVAPVFFAIPIARAQPAREGREEYLARLLRRSIGYQVKIKR